MPTANKRGCITICEDKATDRPRQTIRDKVWPEIAAIEEGERDNEVLTEVATLLATIQNQNELLGLIEELFWNAPLRYRLCVTIDDPEMSDADLAALFTGYDGCVPGEDLARRRAETVAVSPLREWMDEFCKLVVAELSDLRGLAGV